MHVCINQTHDISQVFPTLSQGGVRVSRDASQRSQKILKWLQYSWKCTFAYTFVQESSWRLASLGEDEGLNWYLDLGFLHWYPCTVADAQNTTILLTCTIFCSPLHFTWSYFLCTLSLSTVCGDTITVDSADTGSFSIPWNGGNYAENLNCTITFDIAADFIVTLSFTNADIAFAANLADCTNFDYIEVSRYCGVIDWSGLGIGNIDFLE